MCYRAIRSLRDKLDTFVVPKRLTILKLFSVIHLRHFVATRICNEFSLKNELSLHKHELSLQSTHGYRNDDHWNSWRSKATSVAACGATSPFRTSAADDEKAFRRDIGSLGTHLANKATAGWRLRRMPARLGVPKPATLSAFGR